MHSLIGITNTGQQIRNWVRHGHRESPARFGYTGDQALIGLESEADATHAEAAQISFGTPAVGAAAVAANLKLLLAITFVD